MASASAAPQQNEVLNYGGGKDTVIIASKENHDKPSSITLVDRPDDREPGPILPNGEINWGCPCLGSMASGPCAVEFRDAFSCFHYTAVSHSFINSGMQSQFKLCHVNMVVLSLLKCLLARLIWGE